jgi:hypothetical protein
MNQNTMSVLTIAVLMTIGLRTDASALGDAGVLSVEATKHMVKECRQQHENVATMIDELLVEMEMAQRSLDAARTRAVLELSQMRLADLKQDMALCADLMNMIDRRASEHEASRHDQGTGRHDMGEWPQEAGKLTTGDESTVER